MKRLVILALVCLAAWQGYKHYPDLVKRAPSHEAQITNNSQRIMERVRLTVGGQTFVREVLPPGTTAKFPFRVTDDSKFDMVWQWHEKLGEVSWHGGFVPKGPMVQRFRFSVDDEGGVVFQAESKLASLQD